MGATPPTKDEFLTRFPAFANVSPESISTALAFWTNWFSAGTWGQNYWDVVAVATAHSLAIAQIENASPGGGMQAATGNIQSTSGAGVSIGFAAPPFGGKGAAESYWMKTSYGQTYLMMRHSCMPMGTLSA